MAKKTQSKSSFPWFRLYMLLACMAAAYWYSAKATPQQKTSIKQTSERAYNSGMQHAKRWLASLETQTQPSDGSADHRNVAPQGQPSHAVYDYRAGKMVYAGAPVSEHYNNPLTVLHREAYTVAYDEHRNNPAWVAYRVFKTEDKESPPRPKGFAMDRRSSSGIKSTHYKNTGYDRGHMCPNYAIGSRYGAKAQEETFLMTNIVPQTPALNQGPWRELESLIAFHNHLADHCGELWIITGPIYDDFPTYLKKGKSHYPNIEIPDAFFKIVVDEYRGQPRVLAFIMPQSADRRDDPAIYLSSVDAIEAATGFDFLSELHDRQEEKIESEQALHIWDSSRVAFD